jgi:hypothetical protein
MASASDPFTYAKAMERPPRDRWNSAMEEDSTAMLLYNTCSALKSREAL